MQKLILMASFIFLSIISFGQVGINTENPNPTAALDITSDDKGILIPRLILNSLTEQLQPGTNNPEALLVYNTGSTDIEKGFYMWDNTKWVRFSTGSPANNEKFTYAPSISLPVGPLDPLINNSEYKYNATTKVYTIDIYNIFKEQFTYPISSSDVNGTPNPNTPSSVAHLVKNTPSEYTYYVTYADTDLFKNIKINADGTLSYTISETAIIRDNSFMNIVVKFN